MNSKIACLIASLTLVTSLISCSNNTNSQNETAATTTSAVNNPIECQYMYFQTKDCKPSTPSSPIALSQNTYKPEFSSNISTSESSPTNLVSNILSGSRNLASPPNQLSSNPANTQNFANSTSPSRPFSNSNSNLVTTNTVTQLSAPNRQLETSNYNLDYTNNNQTIFPGVTNTPTIEFSQQTVATGVTTNELPLPSSRKNNLVKSSQTQVQELPPPRNLQLPTNQFNAELTPNKIQEPIPYFTPQQVSNNQINSNLNTNLLPVPLSTSNYSENPKQIAQVASTKDSKPSFSTSSNLDYFVDTIEHQLNTNELQPTLNLSPNQVNFIQNNNQKQIQLPAQEKTLQSYHPQQNSPSQSLIKSGIKEIYNSNSNLELGTITKKLPQISQNSDISNNSRNLRPQLSNLSARIKY
ncbi:MAG: hypothetical protein WBB28_16275 [Crinalium sp.]